MKSNAIISFESESLLKSIGLSLRIARKRRGETLVQAAERVGIAKSNYVRLESGDPSVGIGSFIEALNIYGFTNQLSELANPDNDQEGRRLSIEHTLKRKI